MVHLTKRLLVAVTSVGLGLSMALPGGAAAAADDPIRTIATGFAGPLNLAFGPDAQLYVADAFLGQIDQVDTVSGSVTPLITSMGFSPGVDVRAGRIFYTLSGLPESGDGQGPTSLRSAALDGSGSIQLADLLAYELDRNPDGQPQGTPTDADSNPYGVLALRGRTMVTDAAGNDILEVRANGRIRTFTVLPKSFAGDCATAPNNGVPNGGCDPVPTGIVLGADGYFYVSGLGAEVEGFLWKINASTGAIVDTRRGLPPLTGVTAGEDGSVYAASLFAGSIFRFAPDGMVSVATLPEGSGPSGLDYAHGVVYAGTVSFADGPGTVVAVSAAAFQPAG